MLSLCSLSWKKRGWRGKGKKHWKKTFFCLVLANASSAGKDLGQRSDRCCHFCFGHDATLIGIQLVKELQELGGEGSATRGNVQRCWGRSFWSLRDSIDQLPMTQPTLKKTTHTPPIFTRRGAGGRPFYPSFSLRHRGCEDGVGGGQTKYILGPQWTPRLPNGVPLQEFVISTIIFDYRLDNL